MVDRDQLHLIEVGHLAQLFRDADVVMPVALAQHAAGHPDILFVIGREVLALARTRAERSDTEYVGEESELMPVPRVDHRAGSGEPRLFLVLDDLAGDLLRFVLNETVRP